MDDLIAKVEKQHIKDHPADPQPGDTVRVRTRMAGEEGQQTRLQTFEGVVIARQGGGINETMTVRRITFGIGVERTFSLHSPIVEDIEVVRRGDVRRAKLYYLRQRRGRAARVKQQARAPKTAPMEVAPPAAESAPEPTEVSEEQTAEPSDLKAETGPEEQNQQESAPS